MAKNTKQYRVLDPEDADRVYTKAVHGFDFKAEKGKAEIVDEATMKLLKQASSFLEFEEVGKEKKTKVEEPVLGSRRTYMARRKGRN